MTDAVLNTAELKLLADREKHTQAKREERRRKAEETARQAMEPSPTGYRVPEVPGGASALRKWIRHQHNAYSRRDLAVPELDQCRHTFRVLMDSYRASAELRKAEAAIRQAEASERLADFVSTMQHGSLASVLFAQMTTNPDAPKRKVPWREQPALNAATPPAENGT